METLLPPAAPAVAAAAAAAGEGTTAASSSSTTTTAGSSTPTTILDLPLSHILVCVPQQQRLRDCALVCRAFREAAAAATSSVSLDGAQTADLCCRALLQWAHSNAPHVSTLQLSNALLVRHADEPTLALCDVLLPLPALQRLHLSRMQLQLPAASRAASSNTALTELHICDCSTCELECFSALAALSRMQRLRLSVLVPPLMQSLQPRAPWRLPGSSTWACLAALTHLDLGSQHNVTDAALHDLARSVTGLRELHLLAAGLSAGGLSVLTALQQLSALALRLAPHIEFSDRSTPVLTQLTSLRSWLLFCWKGDLQPALLASLSQLQRLDLRAWSSASRSHDNLSALLAALGQLTSLTALLLRDVLLQANPSELLGTEPLDELPAPACAALTASSRLQVLHIRGAGLPADAWLRVFPATQQQQRVPLLQELLLEDVTPALSGSDLEQAVRCCCGGLTGLTLLKSLQPGASLAPLLPLSATLRELQLRHLHGDSGARVLAQLTALQRLSNDDANLSPAGLLRLTALRGLTSLHMHFSPEAWSLPRAVSLTNQAAECFVPDVCAQLQQLLQGQV